MTESAPGQTVPPLETFRDDHCIQHGALAPTLRPLPPLPFSILRIFCIVCLPKKGHKLHEGRIFNYVFTALSPGPGV